MRFALVLAMVAACEKGSHGVTTAEATELAKSYAAAMLPCDEDKLAALIDGEAMGRKVQAAGRTHAVKLSEGMMRDPHTTAHNLCIGAVKTEAYRLLHVKTVDGEQRPVMRRLARSGKGIVAVAYDELQLVRSDGKVRVADIYAYATGGWMTETVALGVEGLMSDGTMSADLEARTLREARELRRAGKYSEALAKLDLLPPAARRTRMVQTLRVHVAEQVSTDAYKQALDELVQVFPNDPALAQLEVDGAFLRGDFEGALHAIDLVDAAVGGDPFQDAVRAEVYLRRGKPGDVELAAARADAAITAEPTLAKGWYARLEAAVHAKKYPLAIETMKHLEEHFQATFNEDVLRKTPAYAEFLDSAEYKAFRGG